MSHGEAMWMRYLLHAVGDHFKGSELHEAFQILLHVEALRVVAGNMG